MLKGLSLVELATKIEANKAESKDYIADTRTVTMQVVDGAPKLEMETSEGDMRTLAVTETAHDQIGARLNIPAKYYDRMREDAPDLLATNVNAWFRKNPEKRMIRTTGDRARAFLSNRYQRIDNHHVAEMVLPILLKTPGLKVVSAEVTERRMYIQATTDRVRGDVKLGDTVQAGVVIRNSEIGYGAAEIAPLAYRLACLNGMVLNDNRLRAYHVGGRIDNNEELWRDDTRAADDKALLLKIRDAVTGALDQTVFNKRIEKMSALTTAKIGANPEKTIELVAEKIGATEDEKSGMLRALIEGGDLSAWGVVNAVTHQAHNIVNYDRSFEFEQAGGRLIELSPKEWNEVLLAA